MESRPDTSDFGPAFVASDPVPGAAVMVLCEHASNRVPAPLGDLGVSAEVLQSHVAWDPGAAGVAQELAGHLSAPLVRGDISRLVYDCNRPPEAPSAIPERSEIHDIPGNTGLTPRQRQARVDGVYEPFVRAVGDCLLRHRETLELMVTIHSFTPVYQGAARDVELGLLHGKDTRFAEAMMLNRPDTPRYDIRLNEPYSARDGVAHSLDLHGTGNGLLTVMIEIRNDLIATGNAQTDMAGLLAPWISRTLKQFQSPGDAA